MRRCGAGSRVLIMLSLLMCHAAGQSTGRVSQKLKNCEATFSSGRLDILANGRASVINSSSVPIPDNECDTRCIDVTAALSGGCYGKCAWASPEVVACDAAKDRLFLGIYTGLSQNKTIVLVQANLRDKSFRHIAARSAAGLTNGAVSPSGKFLAYSRWTHGGACFNVASVEIVDLGSPVAWDRSHAPQSLSAGNQDTPKIANFGIPVTGGYAAKQVSTFVPIRWRSESELEVQESVRRTDDCTSIIRPVQHIVDIRGLEFVTPAPMGNSR